jgi:hypothetical protein
MNPIFINQSSLYSVDITLSGQVIATVEIRANNPGEAAYAASGLLNLNAKKLYRKDLNMSEETKEAITSMHEVTPLDKETQDNLEGVDVGDKVPMVPGEDDGDKHLKPGDPVSYEDAEEDGRAIFTRADGSTFGVSKDSVLYSQLKEQVDQRNAE